jgi:mRNA interferase MazF
MHIRQGAVYWVQISNVDDINVRIAHPYVVIQDNALNLDSSVATVTLCAVTTNVRKIAIHGNVLLNANEANLTRQSIVEVSKVVTIDKSQLGAYIGILSQQRVQQILSGMCFVQRSFLRHDPGG